MAAPQQSADVGSPAKAFGAVNRNRLIELYFAESANGRPAAETAWRDVYRLLLWADQTNGLAHCYESDKSQPGRNWYGRSLAFHDWLAQEFNVAPSALAKQIDWLFIKATADLAVAIVKRASRIEALAKKQRAAYEARDFPRPGEDVELVAIVKEVLGDHLSGDFPQERWQLLVQRVRQYLTLENKRKNLVGEGFEDVLAAVVRRTCGGNSTDVRVRSVLQDLPGFSRERRHDKPNKVDLAIVRPGMRTLVTAKWSVRADREKQFAAEFGEYVQAETDGRPFEYVFVTNEFDPARLMRACEKLAVNAPMFTHVVHINTAGLRAAYGETRDDTMKTVLGYIDKGRLLSLSAWLTLLSVE
ncbi:MAG: hypothetical protein WDM79_02035 [Terricaulis sp.]